MIRPRRPRHSRALAGGLAGFAAVAFLAFPEPVAADRVLLVNGKVFEDVTAEVRESTVALWIGGGALTLPKDQIASIEGTIRCRILY